MKRSFLVSLVLGSLLLAACQADSGTNGNGSSSGASSRTVASASSPSSVSSVSADASSSASLESAVRTIRVVATNWSFTPSTINAQVGEKVKLEVVSVSGNHGIGVPVIGLDVKINEGQTVTVDLPTDKAGTFPFRCNVLCGEGHFDMMGAIVIE